MSGSKVVFRDYYFFENTASSTAEFVTELPVELRLNDSFDFYVTFACMVG